MTIRRLVSMMAVLAATSGARAAPVEAVIEHFKGPTLTCEKMLDAHESQLISIFSRPQAEVDGDRLKISFDIDFQSCRQLANATFGWVATDLSRVLERTAVNDEGAPYVVEVRHTLPEVIVFTDDLKVIVKSAVNAAVPSQRVTMDVDLREFDSSNRVASVEMKLRAVSEYRSQAETVEWSPLGYTAWPSYRLRVVKPVTGPLE